jgi:hypothetical protein
VWQGQPTSLLAGGDPSWVWTTPSTPVDLRGDCLPGAHGGSHPSSFAGTIRKGELTSGEPIRHALEVNPFAQWLSRGLSGTGYRWPAFNGDSYWASEYRGSVTALSMGSLPALPPDVDLSFVKDARVRKLAEAMRDHGTNVVDDSGWDDIDFSAEADALADFPRMNMGDLFSQQLGKLMTLLHVVDNNAPGSVGGGGTPRQPLAPPL